jgi:hypothetical protein
MPAEEIERAQEREGRCVFAFFTAADEGRGREQVAECRRKANARLISQAPAMYEMLESLSETDLGGYNAEVTALLTAANPERSK